MNNEDAVKLALLRLHAGDRQADVALELISLGCSRDQAQEIVTLAADVARENRRRHGRSDGYLEMFTGGLLLFVGLASAVYVLVATPGWILVPGGVLAWGSYLFFTGWSRK